MIDSKAFGSLFLTFIHEVFDIIEENIYKTEKYIKEPDRIFIYNHS